ncbi:YybH family protein [Portibacter marinus]|uniref:YybH family protein n=1 Tax=Portibacter marinus TaxID=2898660 RepID=UPI001F440536|nr:nuclear transport factor 2 family protein [Portibacter marinus]
MRFAKESGPIIHIDETHNNFHILSMRFAPFAKLARLDGYRPKEFTTKTQLENVVILVIANPIHVDNVGNWKRPIHFAFSEEEVKEIKKWVHEGGRLLLIADHMPFSGAAQNLAQEFGFDFCDGFTNVANQVNGNDVFSIENGKLLHHDIVNGTLGHPIKHLTTFTGSAFAKPENAEGILAFEAVDTCLQPDIAWRFDSTTTKVALYEFYQGATLKFGQGRIAVFGEAAMFTAQSVKQRGKEFKVGFNAPHAHDNVNFIRNVLAWLSEGLPHTVQKKAEEQLLDMNRAMEEVFNAGQYSEVAEKFYAEEARMVGAKTEVIGLENIIQYWSKFQGELSWEIESIEISKLAENVYLQRGISTIQYVEKGVPQESKSIFSLIWKNTEYGWKIVLDHFSPR